MNITEEFQFSVLTAPVAACDRRTLSQAWFSALYMTKSRPPQGTVSTKGIAQAQAMAKTRNPESNGKPVALRTARPQPKVLHSKSSTTPMERRAQRLPLATRIEKFAASVHTRSAAATFVVDSEHGRVGILVRSQGRSIRLVAICSERAKTAVAQALAQARYMLAPLGMTVQTETRDAQC